MCLLTSQKNLRTSQNRYPSQDDRRFKRKAEGSLNNEATWLWSFLYPLKFFQTLNFDCENLSKSGLDFQTSLEQEQASKKHCQEPDGAELQWMPGVIVTGGKKAALSNHSCWQRDEVKECHVWSLSCQYNDAGAFWITWYCSAFCTFKPHGDHRGGNGSKIFS